MVSRSQAYGIKLLAAGFEGVEASVSGFRVY